MKVWIVEGDDQEDQQVRSVHATEIGARVALAGEKQWIRNYLCVTEYEVVEP